MSHFEMNNIISRLRTSPKLVSSAEVSRALVSLFDRMDALEAAAKPKPSPKKGKAEDA